MAATLSTTLTPGGLSTEVAVLPGRIFTVQSDKPVRVLSKRGEDGWDMIASANEASGGTTSMVVVATGEVVKILNDGDSSAEVEVYVPA